MLGRPLDAGRDALEEDRQLLEGPNGQEALDHAAQGGVRVQVGPLADEVARPPERSGEDPLLPEREPHVAQPLDRVGGRFGGDGRAVDGSHRRAHNQVRHDAALEHGLEHAHLAVAEVAAAAEHEADDPVERRPRRGARRGSGRGTG